MKKMRRAVLAALAATPWVARGDLRAVSVVFLDPGSPSPAATGPMSRMANDFMQLAARQLGLQLEILHAEHDHLRMIRQAESVAARSDAPDYVILVNDKLAAPAMFAALSASPARLFVIHSDVTDAQRATIGNERERIARWIGSATPDNPRGVFRLAAALHGAVGAAPVHALAITGPQSTPVATERLQGLQDYLRGVPGARLEQVVYADWSEADGSRKAGVLLARYPQTNLIWAANDDMALGALAAARALDARIAIGGAGGWAPALRSIAEGGLAATLVGHHLIGAIALVMLFDHAQGIDFASDGGARRKIDYLHVVTPANLRDYEAALAERDRPIDFSRHSKALHGAAARYDFGMARLLARAG